ncbi:MAG: DUF5309 family protein [Victivallaceae bacterium]|nr:DUF5309 family protein [Victivallaceae bacterium]
MAFYFGQFNEFGDSVTIGDPVVEAVARAINLGPYVGKIYQAMGAPMATLTEKAFKVYNRTKTSRGGAIDANWDNSATTDLAVGDDALKGITVGHVLKIGTEVVIVKSVDRTNGQIDVHKRGDGGSSAAAHTSGDTFKVIGFAGSDTDLKNVESVNEATEEWENYVQTVFETIDWTKHAELVRKGLDSGNAILVLVREAEIRIAEILASMAVNGVKAKATGSTERYMSAGLLAQLNDSSNRGARRYNANGVLTEAKFKASLKAMFDAGGNGNTILCSPTSKDYIDAFLGSCSAVQLTDAKGNHTAGGLYVNAYDYQGNRLGIMIDSDMPDDQIAIVNLGKCKKGWLDKDGLRMVDEPSQSSRESRKSIQGSVGFLVEDVGTDHQLIYGITGGSTERVTAVSMSGQPIATYQQITVNADADVPAAAAANIGLRVLIGTAWTGGTKITAAVKGEVWASNGAAWVKQS